jgi:type II secretory pathway pseudopilin PulG
MRRKRLQSNRRPRAGWMLIELVAMLTIVGIAATMSTYLIVKMLRASQVQADALVRDRTLHLWADQFRLDGRMAEAARMVGKDPAPAIQFQQADTVVTYSSVPTGLERRVNDQLAGRWATRGRWSFTLTDGQMARAELVGPTELSTTEGLARGQRELPGSIQIRIDAAIGRRP